MAIWRLHGKNKKNDFDLYFYCIFVTVFLQILKLIQMKKTNLFITVLLGASLFMTSCYSYKTVVGSGGQGGEVVKKWNHYLINGLVPIGVSDAKAMAGGATNYTVETKHNVWNIIVSALTFNIYTPTTTVVTK